MIRYLSPETKVEIFYFAPASSQYTVFLTPEECPAIVQNPFIAFTGNSVAHCDSGTLEEAQNHADPNIIVTCSNIPGEYHIIGHSSDLELGGGLSCEQGDISLVAPFTVSPELPDDCIITTISFNNSPDLCSAS